MPNVQTFQVPATVSKTNAQEGLREAIIADFQPGFLFKRHDKFYVVPVQPEKAREIFESLLEGEGWASFGRIAAEADLHRTGS